MTEFEAWVESVSRVSAGAMFASVWQGILLAVFVWVGLKFSPRTNAGMRFLVWTAAFTAAALLPLFSLARTLHPAGAFHPATVFPVIQLDSRWAMAVAALWLVCALARAFGLIRNALRLHALWKRAVPVDVPELEEPLHAGFRAARLCISSGIDQPCVIGFFAPRVLIPEWIFSQTDAAELKQIVLHEAAHLRRFDDWTNLLQKIALVCFPMNPALFWVEKQLCSEREVACDESVVRATGAPHEYASCLTNLAEARMEQRRRSTAVLSLGAWEKRSELARRIGSILRRDKAMNSTQARIVFAALMVAIVAGAVKLGSFSPLVAFTPAPELEAGQARPVSSDSGRAAYRDVVFREPSASRAIAFRSGLVSDGGATNRTVSGRKTLQTLQIQPPKTIHKPAHKAAGPGEASFRRTSFRRLENVPSWIIVTRWEASSSRRTTVTVIDGVVRISALSAAQLQPGWYIVPL